MKILGLEFIPEKIVYSSTNIDDVDRCSIVVAFEKLGQKQCQMLQPKGVLDTESWPGLFECPLLNRFDTRYARLASSGARLLHTLARPRVVEFEL